MGWIREHIDKIKNILNMLEPTTLPMAISLLFFKAATIEVANSGKDVPAATIVSLMSFSLTPNDSAISMALSTTS